MNIQTGIGIGLIVLLSIVGLGLFLQLISFGKLRRASTFHIGKFCERILHRK